ncbi:MAG: TonB-dependent receptor plug domain-containing protein [Pseudomonadota bacterium]
MPKKLACLTALAAFTAFSSHAQSPETASAASVFTPEDFARFSPRTALDLVREVPGFSIEGSGGGGRGLGQASGNVLINGQRISGKSTDSLDVLDRISVARVERLELVDAASLGIPGLSGQVINVITTGGELSGVWAWRGRIRERLEPRWGDASLSLNGETGNLAWQVGIESDENRFGNAGPEFITDPFLNVVERRDEDLEGYEHYLEGSAGLTWTPPNGHEANFNASYAVFNFNRRLRGVRTRFDGSADPLFRRFESGEDEWNAEISGDYAIPILDGTLKLIGLHRHEDSRFRARVQEINNTTGDFLGGVRLDDDFIENESIGRAEFDISWTEGRSWQLAVESAYNRLDAGSSFFLAEADCGETLDDRAVPTLVEENRYEVSLTHSRSVSPKLSVQASLSGEYSELSSEVGADTQSESFVRPKGYVSGTYAWDEDTDMTLRVEREVGQLSFFDFVASQDLNNGNDDAANRDLVPAQAWTLSFELDRDFGDFGAAELQISHSEIEDRIDRVPLPGGGEGPGNVDSAQRSELELSTTLRLDPLGLDGVQLDLEWETFLSSIEDQLTGETRRLSGSNDGFWFAELRWDIPNTDFAVLIAGERGRSTQRFRLDEIQKFQGSEPFVWIEAEHKDFFGTNAFVRIGNLLDSSDVEDRLLFEPDRTGAFIGRQRFDRDFGHILTFGLSGDF